MTRRRSGLRAVPEAMAAAAFGGRLMFLGVARMGEMAGMAGMWCSFAIRRDVTWGL